MVTPFEVVYSRCTEPVAELLAGRWPLTVYNKGEPPEVSGGDLQARGACGYPVTVIPLPNVGMDCHSILTHLAERYDTLAEVTLFLSGNWRKRPENVCLPLESYACASVLPTFPIHARRWVRDDGWPGRVKHWGKWAALVADGTIRRSPWTLGEWWDRVVGGDRPEQLLYAPGQTFSVACQYVHLRPREYWAQLAEFFSRHAYPEECHYLERTWLYLFRPGGRPDADV